MNLAEKVRPSWALVAGGEAIDIQVIGGTVYAFTSELGALRLLKAFRHCGDRADAKFSSNVGSWYFRLEPKN